MRQSTSNALLVAPRGAGPAPPAREPVLIQVPGPGYYSVDARGVATFVPRWEVPSIVSRPQPEPLAVHGDGVWGSARIVRFWRSLREVKSACRLCPVCHAFRYKKRTVCAVEAPYGTAVGKLRMYQVRQDGVDGRVLTPDEAGVWLDNDGLFDPDTEVDPSLVDPDVPFDVRGPERDEHNAYVRRD
jgi:hypothetical protein